MKVAIVHDFLMQMGGAEKVVEVLHDMFPDAPIYTSAYDAKVMPMYYRTWDIRTSFMQRMWWKKHSHRLALLMYPTAFESFDLSDYDLVISSSSAFAKGVITQPHTRHISYTYTPMRYAWTTRRYMENERLSRSAQLLAMPSLHYLRTWDAITVDRVDKYIAISQAVSRRIEKFYRRPSTIVHPPVETGRFHIDEEVGDYYLIVSRLVPYKRLDLAVEAFNRLKRPLKIVGTGRQYKALKAMANSNIEFLGQVDDVELPNLMARAKAYVMPGEEDFGLAPVEANACGRPVIAYASGGALDTQIHGETGVLFSEYSTDGLYDAVREADKIEFDPRRIQAHARQFDTSVFREKMWQAISDELACQAADNASSSHRRLVASKPFRDVNDISTAESTLRQQVMLHQMDE
jgi:glycosyltransferase involved in cell wall biosynthesis